MGNEFLREQIKRETLKIICCAYAAGTPFLTCFSSTDVAYLVTNLNRPLKCCATFIHTLSVLLSDKAGSEGPILPVEITCQHCSIFQIWSNVLEGNIALSLRIKRLRWSSKWKTNVNISQTRIVFTDWSEMLQSQMIRPIFFLKKRLFPVLTQCYRPLLPKPIKPCGTIKD